MQKSVRNIVASFAISLLLAVGFVVLAPVDVFASEPVISAIAPETAAQGSEFELAISLDVNPGVTGVIITVGSDTDVIRSTAHRVGLGNMTVFLGMYPQLGTALKSYNMAAPIGQISSDTGEIIDVTFAVDADADLGLTTITVIQLDADNEVVQEIDLEIEITLPPPIETIETVTFEPTYSPAEGRTAAQILEALQTAFGTAAVTTTIPDLDNYGETLPGATTSLPVLWQLPEAAFNVNPDAVNVFRWNLVLPEEGIVGEAELISGTLDVQNAPAPPDPDLVPYAIVFAEGVQTVSGITNTRVTINELPGTVANLGSRVVLVQYVLPIMVGDVRLEHTFWTVFEDVTPGVPVDLFHSTAAEITVIITTGLEGRIIPGTQPPTIVLGSPA